MSNSNNTLHIFKLEFGSHLSYAPNAISKDEWQARNVMLALKGDLSVSKPPAPISEVISRQIKARMTMTMTLPYNELFKSNPTLIPVPKSSLMRPGDLWVPQRIATALVRNGLGDAVVECLVRNHALPKSATSLPANRPTVEQHYNSLNVRTTTLHEPREILLIDDVITRGATILGAANRLGEVFPKARIRAFAAMRAMSLPFHFNKLIDPCKGDITFDGSFIHREP